MNVMVFLVLWMASTSTPTMKFYASFETMKACKLMLDRIDLDAESKKDMRCIQMVAGPLPEAIKE